MEHTPIGRCSSCCLGEGLLKCSDCLGEELLCKKCCVSKHRAHPFHRISRWTGKFFLQTSLYYLGYILHLGHGGFPCPLARQEEWDDIDGEADDPAAYSGFQPEIDVEAPAKENVLVVVHTSGVFHHRARWCVCKTHNGGDVPRGLQLLRLRLFPGSHKRPHSAFTFDVLDHFYLDAMVCKTSASGFWTKITRLTNNAFPGSVPVKLLETHHKLGFNSYLSLLQDRCQMLTRVSREYRDLLTRKRFGFGHVKTAPGDGDLALFCVACPQPGVNLPPNWELSNQP